MVATDYRTSGSQDGVRANRPREDEGMDLETRPENRRFPRLKVEMRVHVTTADGEESILFTHDWSPTGVFVRTRKPLPVATHVTLSTVLSGHHEQLKWPAIVARTVLEGDPSHDRPPGMAFTFLRLPRALEDFLVAEHRRVEMHRTDEPLDAPLELANDLSEIPIVSSHAPVMPLEKGYGAPGTVTRRGVAVDLAPASPLAELVLTEEGPSMKGLLVPEERGTPLPEDAAAALLTPIDEPPTGPGTSLPPGMVPIELAPGPTGLDGAYVPPIEVIRPLLLIGGERQDRLKHAVYLDARSYDVAVADTPAEALALIEHGLSPEAYVIFEAPEGHAANDLRALISRREGLVPPKVVIIIGEAPGPMHGHLQHAVLLMPRDTTPAALGHMITQALRGPPDDEVEVPVAVAPA